MLSHSLALIALVATKRALAQQTCFALKGNSDDGSVVDTYAVLSDTFNAGTTNAVFTSADQSAASVFSLNDASGLVSGGLIGNTDAGLTLDYIFFDTQAAINTNNLQAATCSTENDNLTCNSQTMSVLQICDSALSIGESVNTASGCVGVTVSVESVDCPADTSTSTATDASSTATDATTATDSSTATAVTTAADGGSTSVDATATSDLALSSSVPGATVIAGQPTSSGSSTTSNTATNGGVPTTLATTALVTSTVFTTQTVTTTTGNATQIFTTAFPLFTTICPPGSQPSAAGGPVASGPTALPAYAPHAAAFTAGSICPSHLLPNGTSSGGSGGSGGSGNPIGGAGSSAKPWYPYTKASTAAGAAGTGSFGSAKNSTMHYEGGASTLTFGLTGIFAAILAFIVV